MINLDTIEDNQMTDTADDCPYPKPPNNDKYNNLKKRINEFSNPKDELIDNTLLNEFMARRKIIVQSPQYIRYKNKPPQL